MTPIITDRTLTAGAHTETLPGLPYDTAVDVWSVPADYRASGIFAAVQLQGQPREIPACDIAAAQLLATLPLPADPAAQLDRARSERLAGINADADTLVGELAATYPEREIQSWPQQVKEADALAVDTVAAAPLLSAMAAARGVDRADLAARVLAKASAYAAASGAIIGARQRLEDLLAAAETLDDLAAVPSLGQVIEGAPQ